MLKTEKISLVEVLKWPEFQIKFFYEKAKQEKVFKDYLPDLKNVNSLNRDWLFNVLETLKPGHVRNIVDMQAKKRNEYKQEKIPESIMDSVIIEKNIYQ